MQNNDQSKNRLKNSRKRWLKSHNRKVRNRRSLRNRKRHSKKRSHKNKTKKSKKAKKRKLHFRYRKTVIHKKRFTNERNASLVAHKEIVDSITNDKKKSKIMQIDNAFLDLTMFYLPLFPKALAKKISSCVTNLDKQIMDCESIYGKNNCEEINKTTVSNQCPPKYKRIGLRKCVKICPENFEQLGAVCIKPKSYLRPLPTETRQACETGNTHKCTFYSSEGYMKNCEVGYTLIGKRICAPICPYGWEDVGKGCVFIELITTQLFFKRFGNDSKLRRLKIHKSKAYK